MLLMHMSSRASDHESSLSDNGVVSSNSIMKLLEIDILFGIMSSELKEIDCFMKCLHDEIVDAHKQIALSTNRDGSNEEIEEKLHVAEESLSQSKYQVSELKRETKKFEKILCFDEQETHGQSSSSAVEWKTLTTEQQKYTLQVLEKSLARELDLERKLSDAKQNMEEIRYKLHCAEHETYCLEEVIETFVGRMFEAESSSVVLTGISKELSTKLQLLQFNLGGSIYQEIEVQNKLENSMLKSSEAIVTKDLSICTANTTVHEVIDMKVSLEEAEKRSLKVNSEALALSEKVNSLEQQMTESSAQCQLKTSSIVACQEQSNTFKTEITTMANAITSLKENILKAETRAASAEEKCLLLIDTNSELNKELSFLKGNGAKKANFLAKKLEESDLQLEIAKASVEAIEVQKSILYSALNDMEHLIEELKIKLCRAENRAESANSRCKRLSETNAELNGELSFLRDRLRCLENSLRQSNYAKAVTMKDIVLRTKVITNLLAKLALERKRLQKQISALSNENMILVEKHWRQNESSHVFPSQNIHGSGSKLQKSSEESATETLPTSFKFGNFAFSRKTDKAPSDSTEVEVAAGLKLATIGTVVAALVLFSSVLVAYLLR